MKDKEEGRVESSRRERERELVWVHFIQTFYSTRDVPTFDELIKEYSKDESYLNINYLTLLM